MSGLYRIWYLDGTTETRAFDESTEQHEIGELFNTDEENVLAVEQISNCVGISKTALVSVLGLQDRVIKNVSIEYVNGVITHEDISINQAVVRRMTDSVLEIKTIKFPIEAYNGAFQLLIDKVNDRFDNIDIKMREPNKSSIAQSE